jgi:hypothetical protein
MTDAPRYRVEETAPGCLLVEMDSTGPDWKQSFLLRSDAHHDNAHADHRLELIHLEEARERGAGILDAGDTFCAMQGKYDRRSDLTQCRPEHQQGRYLDSLVETTAEFYEPFVHNWILMAPGNHETAILKRHETDLTDRLIERMRASGATKLYRGKYSGFVKFRVNEGGTARATTMYYFHGSGGGGPMTHGVLSTRRMQSYIPDADIVWSGHTHDQWTVRLGRVRLSPKGSPYLDTVHHVRTPGYKDEFLPREGWAIERGAPPKPLGAVWLNLSMKKDKQGNRVLAKEFVEAH